MKKFTPSDVEEMLGYTAPAVQELSSLPPVDRVPKNAIVIVTDPANPLSKVVYMNSGKYWIVLSSSSVIYGATTTTVPVAPPTPSSAQAPRVFHTAVAAGASILVTIPTAFPSPYSSYAYDVLGILVDSSGNLQVVADPGESNKTPTTITFPEIQYSGTLYIIAALRN